MDPNDFRSPETGRPLLIPAGYWAFIPNPLPPRIDWSPRLVSAVANAERELGRLAAVVTTFPFSRLLIQPFVRNEAVISSRIEGTRASLVDLYTYETTQLSFLEQIGDVREVYNYVRAMDYGLERLKSLPVSLRLVRELHEKLTENVRGGAMTPGELRRSQNWIGPVGSTIMTAPYAPPPVDEMHSALDALEKFIHSDSEIPLLVKTGLVHYQFEAIHPFLDGNGRVGRLLIILLLCNWGLLPQPVLNLSAFFERYRQNYYDLLLGVSRQGDWGSWLLFFLQAVSEQAHDGVVRIQALQELRQKYQFLVERERNMQRMGEVIDFLFTRPVFSIRQAADELGLTFKTAQAYIVKIQWAGVIKEITGHSRNRIFQADEVLRALIV